MTKKTSIKRIVILEDEAAIARLYADKLTEAGFEVKLFEEPEGLLAICDSFKPEVAFIDHTLHGAKQTGISVIPALKKCTPGVIVVMLSNYSAFQMEKEAKKAGASDYLLKIDTPPSLLVTYVKKLAN